MGEHPVPRTPHTGDTKMQSNTTNPRLKKLIRNLKEKEGIWRTLGEEIDTSNKRRAEVNLHKINRELEEKEIAVVPGKVLGYGNLDKTVEISALNFSEEAKEKIEQSNSKAMKIEELMEENPDKQKMKIIK